MRISLDNGLVPDRWESVMESSDEFIYWLINASVEWLKIYRIMYGLPWIMIFFVISETIRQWFSQVTTLNNKLLASQNKDQSIFFQKNASEDVNCFEWPFLFKFYHDNWQNKGFYVSFETARSQGCPLFLKYQRHSSCFVRSHCTINSSRLDPIMFGVCVCWLFCRDGGDFLRW